jgi:hypothetical protein
MTIRELIENVPEKEWDNEIVIREGGGEENWNFINGWDSLYALDDYQNLERRPSERNVVVLITEAAF